MDLLLCYNKGCGKKFDLSLNTEDSCQYHPGVPVFHDAMKGWSCCKKRSTDFTEFLNFPGCTKGRHSNVKPVEPEKPLQEILDVSVEPVLQTDPVRQHLVIEESERPSSDEPLQKLKVTVQSSLQKALDQQLQKMSLENKTDGDVSSTSIAVGTNCKRSGCKGVYQSPESDLENCFFHPGVAIFHEGMKYWSCCQRKTSDFTNFLDQVGCQKENHIWIKTVVEGANKTCRLDWFQTGPDVNVSVFAKLTVPEQSYVEVNKVVCNIHIVFDGGKSQYDRTLILRKAIVPEKSEVKLMGTKVEIILKKAESFSWPSLEIRRENVIQQDTDTKSL